jgi:hypothetical protein
MKELSFEKMEELQGGGWGSFGCSVLMGSWGLVLTYGAATAALTAGLSLGIAAVWTGLSIGLCTAVGSAE